MLQDNGLPPLSLREHALKVLIVEDEPVMALALQGELQSLGQTVILPRLWIDEIEAAIERESPDCALLDVRLGRVDSNEVANILRRRSIRFAWMTGWAPPAGSTELVLKKPFFPGEIETVLLRLCRGGNGQ